MLTLFLCVVLKFKLPLWELVGLGPLGSSHFDKNRGRVQDQNQGLNKIGFHILGKLFCICERQKIQDGEKMEC